MADLKSINLKGTTITIPQPKDAPIATKSTAGVIKVGNGLTVAADGTAAVGAGTGIAVAGNNVSIKPATSTVIGGVKPDGDTITVNDDGTLVATPDPYVLPTASSTTLGGVKIGSGLSIANGVADTNITFDSTTGTLTIN